MLDVCVGRRWSLSVYILGLSLLAITPAAFGADSQIGSPVESNGNSQPAHSRPATLQPASTAERSRTLATYGHLPLMFEANRGQTDPQVKFISRYKQFTLFLTPSEAVFVAPNLTQKRPVGRILGQQMQSADASSANIKGEPVAGDLGSVIRMRMLDANREPTIVGQDLLPGKKYYFLGKDPRKWQTDVPLYSRADYSRIYPGIDLSFRAGTSGLEFDYVIKPKVDPGKISFAIEGAHSVTVDPTGDLVLTETSGELRFGKPVAYQDDNQGNRVPVQAEFKLKRRGTVGFTVGPYDHNRPLIIDPSVVYSTYLGGSSQDEGLGIAIDTQDDAYITGSTMSVNFPTLPTQALIGGFDVFVTKLDPSGNLLFSALFGGTADDIGTSIAVDSTCNSQCIYVTGSTTSGDFPLFGGAQSFLAGTQNAFLLEILSLTDPSQFTGTYIGGSKSDAGAGVTFDGQGNGYVVGITTSPDFPSFSPLPGETQINLGHGTGPADGFVTEVAPQSGVFVFSTFLGGSNNDFASGASIDTPTANSYNLYVSGSTVSPDFFTTPGVVQSTCGTDGSCNNGQYDGFVTSINYTAGVHAYNYSTFLGGSKQDSALSIAADSTGAYIVGKTTSPDFPLQNAYQGSLKGTQNAFVARLNPQATKLVYSTYLGGSGTDSGLGIVIDSLNNAYVTGQTNSPDFPVLFPTQTKIGGGKDAFISAFEPVAGMLTFSTFLGGSGDEDLVGGSIAVDSTQNVYVTGDTNSPNFPTTANAFQTVFGGSGTCTINGVTAPCEDAYLAKINVQPPQNSILTVELTGTGTATVTSSPDGINCTFQNTPCNASFADGTTITLTESAVGTTFNGWSGACSGIGTCVLTLNSNQTVMADFTVNVSNSTLQVIPLGAGSGTITSAPTGINCSISNQSNCVANFATGTTVTLTATPDANSTFGGWGDACSSAATSTTCVLTLTTADTTTLASATFNPNVNFSTLSVTLGGDGSGVIVSVPTGIQCPNLCTASFPVGTMVTLAAKPTNGSKFSGWSGDCTGTGDCTLTMDSGKQVTANFCGKTCEQSTLSVTLAGAGTGTVVSTPPGINCPITCSQAFSLGTVLTLVATPDTGFSFGGWGADASSCTTNLSCTLTLNTNLVGAIATFNGTIGPPPSDFTLTISPPGNALIASGGSGAYGLNMLSLNGFADSVNLTCSVQPTSGTAPTCSLVPATVALGANQGASSTLTINAFSTTAALGRRPRTGPSNPLYALWVPFVGMGFLGIASPRKSWLRRRFRFWSCGGLALVLLAVLSQVSCGGGAGSSSAAGKNNSQPGNYVVTVTATGATTQMVKTVSVSVTVQ